MNKMILVALTLSSSTAAYADCASTCIEQGHPGIVAKIETSISNIAFGQKRYYGTWVRSCKVTSQDGRVFLEDEVSGTRVLEALEGSEDRPAGTKLYAKYLKRTGAQTKRVSAALYQCQQAE